MPGPRVHYSLRCSLPSSLILLPVQSAAVLLSSCSLDRGADPLSLPSFFFSCTSWLLFKFIISSFVGVINVRYYVIDIIRLEEFDDAYPSRC